MSPHAMVAYGAQFELCFQIHILSKEKHFSKNFKYMATFSPQIVTIKKVGDTKNRYKFLVSETKIFQLSTIYYII